MLAEKKYTGRDTSKTGETLADALAGGPGIYMEPSPGRHELYVGDRCIASCGSEASLRAARSLLLGPDSQERARF